MSLGQNIMKQRKALKLSQEYIAEQLGVSRQAVSKWETGQTEPTAKNLVELARLFDMTVSELVEPEKLARKEESDQKTKKRRTFEIIAIVAYTAMAIMSSIRTNDPGFKIYASVCILIPAVIMVVNIGRLPTEVRLNMAMKELAYCIVIYCTVTFLASAIGNVFSSVIAYICCVLYVKYVRFPEAEK